MIRHTVNEALEGIGEKKDSVELNRWDGKKVEHMDTWHYPGFDRLGISGKIVETNFLEDKDWVFPKQLKIQNV